MGAILFNKKSYIFMLIGFMALLPFQNCGQEYNPTELYANQSANSEDCISQAVDCGAKAEFLQILINISNPSVFPATTTFFTASGRCNTGNYDDHFIYWEIRNGTGTKIASREEAGVCIKGKYEFRVNITGVAVNQSHTFSVTMYGVDAEGNTFSNSQSDGVAQIDFSRK